MAEGKYSKRMLAAAGSLAGLTVAHQVASHAALIHVDDRPLTIKYADGDGYEVQWDIDGNSVAEYALVVKDSTFYDEVIISSGGLNGQGFVRPVAAFKADAVQALTASFTVDGTLDFGSTNTYRTMLSSSGSAIGSDFTDGGIAEGSNFVGFRFTDGVGQFYGYAEFIFNGVGNGVTISQWWYDDAGGPVHVAGAAPVPEPNTLALLALGAAGLASYRAARKKIALGESQKTAS